MHALPYNSIPAYFVLPGCPGTSCLIMGNIYNYIRNIILLLAIILSFSACLREGENECGSFRLRITPVVVKGLAEIKPEDIKSLKLFVYDASNGELLTAMETAINREEVVNFPGVKELRFVAMANAEEHLPAENAVTGSRIGDVSLSLKTRDVFNGMQLYELPDDLCWGEVNIMNDDAASAVVELPLKRIVAGIHIRIRGLKDFNKPATKSVDDDYSVILGVAYNKVNFEGRPFNSSTKTSEQVYHRVRGEFREINGIEFYVIPEPEQILNILSSDEGTDITMSIYRGDTPLVADIAFGTVNGEQGPLTTYNGKKHLIDVNLSATAGVVVTLTVDTWQVIPLPEVEF